MSKIQKITVSNLKAVKEQELNLQGCTAIITAGNNKGKTSLLRSLIDRMRGIKTDRILKQGETNGFYEMELDSGEKFKWQFDEKKEKLIFVNNERKITSITKEICSYFFPKIFDIDAFLEQEPKEQAAQIYKIANIDFTDVDKAIKEAQDGRYYAKKRAEEQKLLLIDFDPKMKPFEDVQGLAKLQHDYNQILLHNEKIKGFKERLQTKKNDLQKNTQHIADILLEIERLKTKVKQFEEDNMQLETDIDKGENALKEEKFQIIDEKKTQEMAEAIVKKRNELEEVRENNEGRKRQENYDKALKIKEDSEALVKKLEGEKSEALRCAKLPEGFGFNDDGITYDGFAFNKQQLSLSKIYIAALKLAAIGLGEVKTLYFDASALDRQSLQDIEKWAKTQGLQLLIERPDFEGGDIQYEILEK